MNFFAGDAAPAVLETHPISEMLFILHRQGIAQPTIIRSALGPVGPYHHNDDLNLVYPGVAVGGGVGPFAQGDANFTLNIPWQDLYYCPNGVPQPIAVAIAAASPMGITIDPFVVWQDVDHDTRYKTISM